MTSVKRLQQELPALKQLLDEKQWKEVQEKVTGLQREARSLGIDSAYLWWCLAVAHDELGEPLAALDAISHAARLDPAHPSSRRIFREVCANARARLRAEAPTSPLIPELHERLFRIGEADVASHLVRARYEFERGDKALAVKLVDAVLVLTPACLEACQLRYEMAARSGDEDASFFELMVDEAELASSTFGVPGPRAEC
jgi:tetratricopeptide (TPR) repeat protein